jgi:hypothetical protein
MKFSRRSHQEILTCLLSVVNFHFSNIVVMLLIYYSNELQRKFERAINFAQPMPFTSNHFDKPFRLSLQISFSRAR